MSIKDRIQLPPNPYKRSPIRKREDLAGRSHELNTIQYYLNLTAAGQCPHLALIGQRGVGKTSLLNGAHSIAQELRLLSVRVDMNEQKAACPGRFWQDLYQTLALAMVKAGCWGGPHGKVYAQILQMMNRRQPGDTADAVLQIPYVFSCLQGSIEDFSCADALVVNDFEVCLAELATQGSKGIAVLIDEADCLAQNVPLLQMFRNIFQAVNHCSLILAGTEAVFPALSEVFSPIPRQFHRVDVKPFASWSDTFHLVVNPLPENSIQTLSPTPSIIQELHELCGGAPDEVQLYCHHMFRSVEEGISERMSLSPQVFREVLKEYRASKPADDTILNAIERLPDHLLFESKWLGRRQLTLAENLQVTRLRRELESTQRLSDSEVAQISREITDGYQALFELGISENSSTIRLKGAPLTAGFWKSFVEVERGKRWTWNDDTFAELIQESVFSRMGMSLGAKGHTNLSTGTDVVSALHTLRAGEVPNFKDGMPELIATCLMARDQVTHVADVSLAFESNAGKQTYECRFLEVPGKPLEQDDFTAWLVSNRELLESNSIRVTLLSFVRWELPSHEELHRLARIAGYRVPSSFGPTQLDTAIEKFNSGDVKGCSEILARMVQDKAEPQASNNLAFCELLLGEVKQAALDSSTALQAAYEPLYELNHGLAIYLLGQHSEGKNAFEHALSVLRNPDGEFDPRRALYVLVLNSTKNGVISERDMPIDAALQLNLFIIGALTRNELAAELESRYQDEAASWLGKYAPQES